MPAADLAIAQCPLLDFELGNGVGPIGQLSRGKVATGNRQGPVPGLVYNLFNLSTNLILGFGPAGPGLSAT